MNKRLLAVCLLLIAACAGSGDASSTTAQTGTTTNITTAVPNAVADGCVVGSWILDLERLISSMEAGVNATGRTAAVSVASGSASITFDVNGAVFGGYEDLTIQADFGGDSSLIDIVLAGQIVGFWSLPGDMPVLIPDERTTLESARTISGTGGVYEVTQEETALGRSIPWPVDRDSSPLPSAISCEGDTLSITPEVQGSTATVWLRS